MTQVQTTIEVIEPEFSAGQCLTAAHLVRLRDYLATLGGALLESWSDGILYGLQLETDDQNGLYVSAGAFKLNGRVGFLAKTRPVAVDFHETCSLVLAEGGALPETAPGHISTEPPEVETGRIRRYTLSWRTNVSSVTNGMLTLGTVRAIAGHRFRNFSIRFQDRPRVFPDILKGRQHLDAGEICRLFTPYACRGRWPTLGHEVQRELAAWLIQEKDVLLAHLIPSLLRGELPVCDYTGRASLPDAAAALCEMLTARRRPAAGDHSGALLQSPAPTRAVCLSNAMKVD